jgi:hypothetical protein
MTDLARAIQTEAAFRAANQTERYTIRQRVDGRHVRTVEYTGAAYSADPRARWIVRLSLLLALLACFGAAPARAAAQNMGAPVATQAQQRRAYRIARMADGWAWLAPYSHARRGFWVPTHELSQRARVGDVVRSCNRPVPTQGRTVRWCVWHARSTH